MHNLNLLKVFCLSINLYSLQAEYFLGKLLTIIEENLQIFHPQIFSFFKIIVLIFLHYFVSMNISPKKITIPAISDFASLNVKDIVIITDENIYALYSKKLKAYNTVVLKAGEATKTQTTVNKVIKQLIEMGANKTYTLVGVGGGVITDITGYVASVFMRGINFGFVPTTILALVDASIGGKNGVNFGIYKNMIGTIHQPSFIIQDISFLKTLPNTEWQYGFAEIIKHACINDAAMFEQLEQEDLKYYKKNYAALEKLLHQNAQIKSSIVANDLYEKGDRKLLNFGHTLAHALENKYKLSHGYAVSIGIAFACKLSEDLLGFKDKRRVTQLLEQYNLPTHFSFDYKTVFQILTKDKKMKKNSIQYILLNSIGSAEIIDISIEKLKIYLQNNCSI